MQYDTHKQLHHFNMWKDIVKVDDDDSGLLVLTHDLSGIMAKDVYRDKRVFSLSSRNSYWFEYEKQE